MLKTLKTIVLVILFPYTYVEFEVPKIDISQLLLTNVS